MFTGTSLKSENLDASSKEANNRTSSSATMRTIRFTATANQPTFWVWNRSRPLPHAQNVFE